MNHSALHSTQNKNESELYKADSDTDLEAQAPVSRALTRADTAAYITKHPSRIPDDGTSHTVIRANISHAQERSHLYRRI